MNRWKSTKVSGRPKISNPTYIERFARNFKYNLLVVCKYNFSAENSKELSIKKGDILKVLDRPGNGWLLVQFVDTVNVGGLVPATYVEIAVNDNIEPVTLQWLRQIDMKHKLLNNISDTALISDNNDLLDERTTKEEIQTRNIRYPTTTTIDNYQLHNNRYLYKVVITYSDNTKDFVLRYYEDFYSLHASLLDVVKSNDGIPQLPEPMQSTSYLTLSYLSRRCENLSLYLNQLLGHCEVRWLKVLSDWLDITYNNLGDAITTDPPSKFKNSSIKPGSEELSNIYDQCNDPLYPSIDDSRKDGSFNPENHPKSLISPPKLTINTSLPYDYEDSSRSLSETSIFSDTFMDTHSTPLAGDDFTSKAKSIKFKIIKNGDMIALKLLRLEITSIIDLKRLVYAKIPHENLYIKLQDFKHIDSSSHEIIKFLSENEKILLKAT